MAQYTQINPDALVTALTPINNSLGGKQDKTDSTLSTTDKTISGAINEINTKVGNLTGAFTWKGKFDTLPAVTDYKAGNVVGVGNKEYVLTVTGSTKAWEELGDEGSYLLKSVAEETYLKKAAGEVATANIADGAVTSTKLATGARKPIILTPDTTEVDEETYQKLLSDDVDVVFKALNEIIYPLYSKEHQAHSNHLILIFAFPVCLTGPQTEITGDVNYTVRILPTGNHSVIITENKVTSLSAYLSANSYVTGDVVYKNKLSKVLKEIDLTGTDADRKAKLDQFAKDWKALTGASDLKGARFAGRLLGEDYTSVFTWSMGNAGYVALSDAGERSEPIKAFLNVGDGSLTITPLFSHLEAITIRTSNTTEAENANKAAIQAYVNNLIELGVDITKEFNVPVRTDNNFYGCLTGKYFGEASYFLSGTIFSVGGANYIKDIYISPSGRYVELVNIQNDNELYTTSKDLIGAINEVNTLAKSKGNGTITEVKMNGVSKGTSGVVDLGTVLTAHQDISGKVDKTLNAKAFEGITIKNSNTTEDKAANVAAIKAYVNNLKALGVDTTKILSIPVRTGIDSIGNLMYRDIGNYFSLTGMVFGFNDLKIAYVYIGNDGHYSEFLKVYDDEQLKTSRRDIVSAINEVNDLAKKKQDTLTSGTNIKTINNQSILGSGNINITGGNTETDTSMSDTSTNPVQNKVIKAYIDGLVGNVAARLAQI